MRTAYLGQYSSDSRSVFSCSLTQAAGSAPRPPLVARICRARRAAPDRPKRSARRSRDRCCRWAVAPARRLALAENNALAKFGRPSPSRSADIAEILRGRRTPPKVFDFQHFRGLHWIPVIKIRRTRSFTFIFWSIRCVAVQSRVRASPLNP